ncbi:NADPH:quinone oxidoreductase family protein [Haliea sp. E17]|uniref:NADPH:quinone oxidoreductase family protein n=1 Tax=Haliea sp. E17 TaxID=3401576 RepID=UPI003AAD71D7
MKAIVCREHGPAESLQLVNDWDLPDCGPGEVRVAVKAAGLNFPDLLMIQGKYQTQPDMPFVPGAECAGVVRAVGEGVTRYKVGDKVIAASTHGAFAAERVVNEAEVYPMPEALSFVQAAGISLTYFTSYHALKQRADLKAGETLLVLGAAGGVGATAVEIGKMLGAHVIAAASSDEKLALCRELGADEVINYSEVDLKSTLKEMTGGRGVDVVYDPVGGDYSEAALRNMAWNGRFLVIGFASGPIPKIPLNLALLKGCSIVGVFYGRFSGEEPERNLRNVEELWQLFAEGKLNPVVTDVFPFEQYVDAFNCLAERRARGKVILDLEQD